MTILHTGSTKAFEAGWRNIFGGKKPAAQKSEPEKPATAKKAKPAKKAAAKATVKKAKKKAKR